MIQAFQVVQLVCQDAKCVQMHIFVLHAKQISSTWKDYVFVPWVPTIMLQVILVFQIVQLIITLTLLLEPAFSVLDSAKPV